MPFLRLIYRDVVDNKAGSCQTGNIVFIFHKINTLICYNFIQNLEIPLLGLCRRMIRLHGNGIRGIFHCRGGFSLIEVKNLTKKYGDHKAVDSLSFTVEQGEILGFLGPNGAGKSTTMNMITGYISATEGTAEIDGHDIFEEPEEAKKCIGYLPEIPPLYGDMRLREYLQFVADLKKVKKSEQKAMLAHVMKMTSTKEMENRLIKNLSKGFKQRVGLAAALIGNPEVLILDEPTVGLDPKQIIEIRDLIRELAKNHTVILSSHILSEVAAVCDRVLIINKGKKIVIDTPDNLSRRMGGSSGIELKVKGEEGIIKKVLGSIDGVTDVSVNKGKRADNAVYLTIYSSSTNEEILSEAVFYALADAKCPILEMKPAAMSLEEVFLEVTKDDSKHISKRKKRLLESEEEKEEA